MSPTSKQKTASARKVEILPRAKLSGREYEATYRSTLQEVAKDPGSWFLLEPPEARDIPNLSKRLNNYFGSEGFDFTTVTELEEGRKVKRLYVRYAV